MEEEQEKESQAMSESCNPPLSPLKSYRGCNCKRSKCLKKYCECFARNSACGANCSCLGCMNTMEARTTSLTNTTSTCIVEADVQSFVASPAIQHPQFPPPSRHTIAGVSFSERLESIAFDEKSVLTEVNSKPARQIKREKKRKLKIRISRQGTSSQ